MTAAERGSDLSCATVFAGEHMAHSSSPSSPHDAVGIALSTAVSSLRSQLGDPFAPIAVVVPAGPNTVLARTALALRGPFIRVWFETPEGLALQQTPPSLWTTQRPEPPGWRRPLVRRLLARLESRRLLQDAGWLEPLLQAVGRLEGHGIDADTVREALGTSDERAQILEQLLRGLASARADAGFVTDADVARAALVHIDDDGVGAAAARGVIVLGDRELTWPVHDFMTAWLARRLVVHVRIASLSSLPAATLGLVGALGAHTVIDVEPAQPSRLRAVQLGHSDTLTAADLVNDTSVEIARTPDDVREAVECVREVKRAIRAGTALDRIAIVLPDGRQRGALNDALLRAAVPATWLIGAPAGELVTARLLTIALEIVAGDDTPQQLYALLSHPALALHAAFGPAAVTGRARWRRFLSQVVHARGLPQIVRGLADMDLSVADDADDVAIARAHSDEAARASLVASITALQAMLSTWRAPATVTEHVTRWSAFLERFARAGDDRGRVLQLLAPYAVPTPKAPLLDVDEAGLEWQRLASREVPRGSLTERSLRVLSPLHLVGGGFDLVCVLGLTEKRFPTASHEDVFITDAMWAALSLACGVTLTSSTAHAQLEQRRFAAVVSATRQRLWLSVPRLDFATERPTLASSFVLDVLTSRLGRRARFGDLDTIAVRRGRRSQSWPADDSDALDLAEHLVVRAAASTSTQAPALTALTSHPSARGVLQLHRSIDTVRQGGAVDAHTGLVPPSLLPMTGLDGEVISVSLLAQLLSAPADVLFARLLRAQSPPWLSSWRDPLATSTLRNRLHRQTLETQLAVDGVLDDELVPALIDELTALAGLGAFGADDIELVRRAIAEGAATLGSSAGSWCKAPIEARPGLVVDSALPWRVDHLVGRQQAWGDHHALALLVEKLRPKCIVDDQAALVLSALALVNAGAPIDGVAAFTTAKRSALVRLDSDVVEELRNRLIATTGFVGLGQWPVSWSKRFALSNERRGGDVDDDNDFDEGGAA